MAPLAMRLGAGWAACAACLALVHCCWGTVQEIPPEVWTMDATPPRPKSASQIAAEEHCAKGGGCDNWGRPLNRYVDQRHNYSEPVALPPIDDIVRDFHKKTAQKPVHKPAHKRAPHEDTLSQLKEENDWKNDIILFPLPASLRARLPRTVQSWLRNWLACMALYFVTGGLWVYYIYWCFGQTLFGAGKMPGAADVFEQIKVAAGSMPLYAALPAATEWLAEAGWTRAYTRIDDVGLVQYLGYFALYMAGVEFGVYWMHRGLHDVRIGYRLLHHIHHKYNKEHTLSPFAGLAFHPLDGILQAIPYCVMLFVVPMHFLTHELLLFATGVWTTNIHDCLHARAEPIMGAGYHTIHHTTYRHNYGHYFIYMDWLFGTLVTPEEYTAQQRSAEQQREAQHGASTR